MMLLRAILFLGIAFFSSWRASAAVGEYKKGYHIEVGAYQNHLTKYFDTSTGYENLMSSFSGYLRLRRTLLIGKKWGFEPSIGTRIPWKSGIDGTTRKFNTHLDFTLSYPIVSWVRFRAGTGVHWVLSIGDGGPVVLNNGTSTSTFYTPGYASNGFIVTAQSGLSFLLGSRLSLNFEIYGQGLFNNLRRDFDVLATLGWRL